MCAELPRCRGRAAGFAAFRAEAAGRASGTSRAVRAGARAATRSPEGALGAGNFFLLAQGGPRSAASEVCGGLRC